MRQAIENYLLENGFQKVKDDLYQKNLQRRVGEIVLNGEHRVQVETLEFCIQYIGEGWEGESEENNNPLTQWKLIIADEDHGDFLVHDINEFKQIFRR